MLAKLSDTTIYRDARHYAAFPTVAALADGRLVVLFRRARDHRWFHRAATGVADPRLDSVDHVDPRSHLALVRCGHGLDDGGGAVESLPSDPEAGDQDASLLVLRDGRLLVGGFGWYPLAPGYGPVIRGWGGGCVGAPESTGCVFLFWGGYTRMSGDGGRSWTPHRYLPALPGHPDLVPGARPCLGGAVRGRSVQAPDGTILLPTYAAHPEAAGRLASHLFASTDGGAAWRYRGVIAVDPAGRHGFAEPALHLGADGRLTAFHRSFGLEDRLVTTTSTDRGASWSAWHVHDRVVGHPFDALGLPDGRVFLVYGYRHPPYGIRARIYDPATGTPDDAPEFIIRADGACRDLGYPWATLTADGRIVVVYYFCGADGIRHIAGSTMLYR